MSYNPFFTVKAQNSNIATFSSTADETFILLIANDVNQVLEDGETVKNNDNSKIQIIKFCSNLRNLYIDEQKFI